MIYQPENQGGLPSHVAPQSYMVPMVLENENQPRERAMDIFSMLLKSRIIIVGTPIDDTVCNLFTAQMLFLQANEPEKKISVYINSPGGSVTAGNGMYDVMQYVQSPIETICFGSAMSYGLVLLAGGSPGMRYALEHATILMHQPWSGGIQGQATDIQIHAKEILRQKDQLAGILAKHSGKKLEVVKEDGERDNFFTAQRAMEYGLIDDVIQPNSQKMKQLAEALAVKAVAANDKTITA